MRVGISGHQCLPDSAVWAWVWSVMQACLAPLSPPLIGVTSLAVGADTLFAEVVLRLGGSLEVIVPFGGYVDRFAEGGDRDDYSRLLCRAVGVEVLRTEGTEEEAYFAAGKRVVDLSSLLILVWDGKPAAGLGGTADVAAYARRARKAVIHINPETRKVSR